MTSSAPSRPPSDSGKLHVTVRLYSVLRHRDGQIIDHLEMELPAGSCVQDVLDHLPEAEQVEPLLVIEEQIVAPDYILSDGDRLAIIPSVAGGCV